MKLLKQLASLDFNMGYRLTKLQSVNNKTVYINIGAAVEGMLSFANIAGYPAVNVTGYDNFIRTSPVVRVIRKTNKRVIFETENSIYELLILGNHQS